MYMGIRDSGSQPYPHPIYSEKDTTSSFIQFTGSEKKSFELKKQFTTSTSHKRQESLFHEDLDIFGSLLEMRG